MDPKDQAPEVPPVPADPADAQPMPADVALVAKVEGDAQRAEAAAEQAGEADAHVTQVAAEVKANLGASTEILEESHKVLAEAQALRDTQPKPMQVGRVPMGVEAAPLLVEDPFDVNYRVVSLGRAASKQIKSQLESNDAERLRFLEQHERERVSFEEQHANTQASLNAQLAEAEGSTLTAAHMLNRILEEIIGGRPLPVKDPEGSS